MADFTLSGEDRDNVKNYITAKDDEHYALLPEDTVAIIVTHSNLPSKFLDLRFDLHTTIEGVKERFRKHSVQVNVEGEIGDLPGVIDKKINKGSVELVLAPATTPQTILDQLRERGITINRFEIKTPSLNEIFLNMAGANHE